MSAAGDDLMRPTDRNGIAVIVAVALASLTVRPLTVDRTSWS